MSTSFKLSNIEARIDLYVKNTRGTEQVTSYGRLPALRPEVSKLLFEAFIRGVKRYPANKLDR
ncbi:MAG: hypothetical protein QM500_08660 [Methylococcales bacterium]